MKPLEAARILAKNGDYCEARGLLDHLWNSAERSPAEEFRIFCALIEVWAVSNRVGASRLLELLVSGENALQGFWERRSMDEQAILLEWHGQFAYVEGDLPTAFSSLTRSASLGRDTSILWRLIGAIHVEHEELELGLRYLRRSLQLFRQLELDLLSGRDFPLGFFTGVNPLNLQHGLNEYLQVLLKVTRVAKGQKTLKSVREFVVELIHHHPSDERLMKIRVLLERNLVQASLVGARPSIAP